jgi:integrase/recombinase XerD
VSLRSARTRRAYFGDLASWLAWLRERQLDPLTASRVQVDVWVRVHTDAGARPATIRRRLSALSSCYRKPGEYHMTILSWPAVGVGDQEMERPRCP